MSSYLIFVTILVAWYIVGVVSFIHVNNKYLGGFKPWEWPAALFFGGFSGTLVYIIAWWVFCKRGIASDNRLKGEL